LKIFTFLEQAFCPKHRAMEMLLVLFYAEELKREVLDCIQTTDRLIASLRKGKQERVPKGVKNSVDKALDALIAGGVLTLAHYDRLLNN
jgi:hypothetical protein